jgi:hypothetical protein
MNFMNANFNNSSNYEKLSYFNELIINFGKIKLELLYGNLGKVERNILKSTLDCVIDTDESS